jgi:hypothetical protein
MKVIEGRNLRDCWEQFKEYMQCVDNEKIHHHSFIYDTREPEVAYIKRYEDVVETFLEELFEEGDYHYNGETDCMDTVRIWQMIPYTFRYDGDEAYIKNTSIVLDGDPVYRAQYTPEVTKVISIGLNSVRLRDFK